MISFGGFLNRGYHFDRRYIRSRCVSEDITRLTEIRDEGCNDGNGEQSSTRVNVVRKDDGEDWTYDTAAEKMLILGVSSSSGMI